MCMWAFSLSMGLLSFLGEQLPAPAPALSVEHAARLYRIEVYNHFRHDRAEYDRRIAQAERVRNFGQTSDDHRETAVHWFVAARVATAGQRAHLPELPASLPASSAVTKSSPRVEHLIITSGSEQPVLVDTVPADVATSLDIQLPAAAEQTVAAPAAATRTKSSFTNLRSPDPEVEGTTAPVVIELPTDKRAIDTTAPAPAETPAKATPKPKSEAAPKTATPAPIETEDPFAVKALFEPATTPAPASEAATDVDPFAP